ncbi:MAG: hypothetical protein M3442_08910, partial [Chloroflexota bacterium]|nr:hypothetical protein [Chloroflexota bacterium]
PEPSAINEAALRGGRTLGRWARRQLPARAAWRTASAALLSISIAGVIGGGTLSHGGGTGLSGASPIRITALAPAGATVGRAILAPEGAEGVAVASSWGGPQYDRSIGAVTVRSAATRVRLRRMLGGSGDAHLTAAERAIYATRTVVVTLPDHTAADQTRTLTLSRATFTHLGRADEGTIPVLIEPLEATATAWAQPHRRPP